MTLGWAMIFQIQHQNLKQQNKKANTLNYIKAIIFCVSKDTIKMNKNNPQKGKKYLQMKYL